MTPFVISLVLLWLALSIGAFVAVAVSERHRRLRRPVPVVRLSRRAYLRSAA